MNAISGVTEEDEILVLPNGNFVGLSINESNDCAAIDVGSVSLNTSSLAVTGGVEAGFVSFATGDVTTGCTCTHGSTSSSGSITGTLARGSGLNVTVTLTTSGGSALGSEALNLPLSPLYAGPGPLSKLAGAIRVSMARCSASTRMRSALRTGVPDGCVLSAQYSEVGDGSHDIYTETASYSGCMGSAAVLNGQTATGTVTLDDTVTPARGRRIAHGRGRHIPHGQRGHQAVARPRAARALGHRRRWFHGSLGSRTNVWLTGFLT